MSDFPTDHDLSSGFPLARPQASHLLLSAGETPSSCLSVMASNVWPMPARALRTRGGRLCSPSVSSPVWDGGRMSPERLAPIDYPPVTPIPPTPSASGEEEPAGVYVCGSGPSVRQSVTTDCNRQDLLWAAGLFVGEGYVTSIKRQAKRSGRVHRYLAFALKMLDGRSVERFAAAFGLRFQMREHERDAERCVFDVRAAGAGAKAVLETLCPELIGTVKADQTANVFRNVGLELPKMKTATPTSSPRRARAQTGPTGRRRVRSWLLNLEKFNREEVAWASGLFAAEGYACVSTRQSRGRAIATQT